MIIYNNKLNQFAKSNYNLDIPEWFSEITEKEYEEIKEKQAKEKAKESEKHQSEYISNLEKEYKIAKKETWYSDEVILIIAPKFASILSNTENAKDKKKTT